MNCFLKMNYHSKSAIFGFGFLFLFLSTISCAVSSAPNVSEIIQTQQPSISGRYEATFTSSSSTFTISGTCDKNSYGTEYSTNDGSSWTDLGDCTNGTFSFNVLVLSTLSVKIRSRTKFAYTGTTNVAVRLAIPPTANLLTFVSASGNARSSFTEPTLNFTMSPFLTGKRTSPAAQTYKLDLHATGIAYAP
jgi:hypothetical protein